MLEKLQEYANSANRLRGRLINSVINLERLIDNYIANYFCPDQEKGLELLAWVVSENLPFARKVKIFEYIAKQHDSRYETLIKPIIKDLHEIRELRNFLAHTYLEVSLGSFENISNSTYSFSKYKHNGFTCAYNDYYVESFIELIQAHFFTIATLF